MFFNHFSFIIKMNMELTYEQLMQGINDGSIEECCFSIKGYNHYHYCSLHHRYLTFGEIKQHDCIELTLTKDGSENSLYYGRFKDAEKLFRIKGKGCFTLREMWKHVEIISVTYRK